MNSSWVIFKLDVSVINSIIICQDCTYPRIFIGRAKLFNQSKFARKIMRPKQSSAETKIYFVPKVRRTWTTMRSFMYVLLICFLVFHCFFASVKMNPINGTVTHHFDVSSLPTSDSNKLPQADKSMKAVPFLSTDSRLFKHIQSNMGYSFCGCLLIFKFFLPMNFYPNMVRFILLYVGFLVYEQYINYWLSYFYPGFCYAQGSIVFDSNYFGISVRSFGSAFGFLVNFASIEYRNANRVLFILVCYAYLPLLILLNRMVPRVCFHILYIALICRRVYNLLVQDYRHNLIELVIRVLHYCAFCRDEPLPMIL